MTYWLKKKRILFSALTERLKGACIQENKIFVVQSGNICATGLVAMLNI